MHKAQVARVRVPEHQGVALQVQVARSRAVLGPVVQVESPAANSIAAALGFQVLISPAAQARV